MHFFAQSCYVAQFAVNSWQEHDFFYYRVFLTFSSVCCNDPRVFCWQGADSDFSAHNFGHNLMLHFEMENPGERRKKNWMIDYRHMFFIAVSVFTSSIFKHIFTL